MTDNISRKGYLKMRNAGSSKDEVISINRIPSSRPLPPKCEVCGDNGSGKHYGAIACHGCRAFFIRASKAKSKYPCESVGKCVISENVRMKCRACRYQRCLKVGMKTTDTVNQDNLDQNDSNNDEVPQVKKSKRKSLPYLHKDLPEFPCAHILWDLQQIQNQVSTKFAPHFPKIGTRYCTSSQDVVDGVTVELHQVVDWAKQIDIFKGLGSTSSKVALLKSHCTQLMFLDTARRWMDLEADDYFLGANGVMVPKFYGVKKRGVANPKVFTEVLEPCRRMKITADEFLCLKALVMFNPHIGGLREEDRWKVGDFQRQIKLIMVTSGEDRMWNLLLLLPSLCSVAEKVKDVMRNRSITEDIIPFKIMRELLLDT